MLEDFIDAKRRDICGIMGDRYINSNDNVNGNSISNIKSNSNSNGNSNNISNGTQYDGRSMWYIDAKI